MTRWKRLVAPALVSAGLSALFVVVYGGSNWLAGQRVDVATWYYAWERLIPFVPWTVVPYMTIDAFFVASPFLCRGREELRTLAKRTAFGIIVAGAFFVVMPLTLAVERPQPEGWTAPIFAFLHGFDRPFNLFPSLHITLRTILGVHYARHTRGGWRVASNVWFSLIGISTLLTCQHHVVDVAGGFALAALCFYVFREEPAEGVVIPNERVGSYYAIGGAVLVIIALLVPRALILFWPALGMCLVAAAYFGRAPNVYRKENGRIPLSARMVLGPVLLGQRISCWWYRRRSDRWNKVTRKVWIGAQLNEREAGEARRQGVTAVLDMTAEFSEAQEFLDVRYLNLPVIDLTAPTQEQLRSAAEFIERASEAGIVYVHCKAGYSRSAAAVGAYLLASGKARSVRECLLLLKGARPSIVVRSEILNALEEYASDLKRGSFSASRED
ncbi:MAG: dual specificity protein phosphatase family protein [Limisphaerales bacterium]